MTSDDGNIKAQKHNPTLQARTSSRRSDQGHRGITTAYPSPPPTTTLPSGAMLPEVLGPSGGIGETAAWRLIYGLHQSRDRFSYDGGPDEVGVRSTRTHELRTALRDLDIQIRTTFTILQLDLLLQWESEREDDASQSSFESESDDESLQDTASSDRDDASSHSGVESRCISPTEERFDIPSHGPSPSDNQALSLLRDLCSLLEVRVNPLLIPIQPEDIDQASGYPRLARLIGYVQSPQIHPQRLEFIPIPGSANTPFLFNVTEDGATATAFVALCDPVQKPPRKRARQRMLAEVGFMRDHFLYFNNFVNSLQISIGSLDSLAPRPSQSSTSTTGSFASFALLQKFRQQTTAAFRAIFSQFGSCAHRESIKQHKILLQLPGWEVASDWNLPVQLFFTSCLLEDWQPASMYFLQSEKNDAYKKQKLCKALSSAHDNDRDLEFYVSEDSESTNPGEIPVHIPIGPKRGRRYGDSFPVDNLCTLIKHGYFARNRTMELLYKAGENAAVMGIDQRKTLAVKLVLGMMLSMDSDYIIGTWDPARIHFLKPMDTELTPFVSIYGNVDSLSRWGCPPLAKLNISGDFGDDDDEPDSYPLLPFTLLAKALLQIACGERLKDLKISYASRKAFLGGWKELRRLIELYLKSKTCENDVDRETLPFLYAALKCLDFHTRYQVRLKSARSNHRIEIAWQLVFDDVIAQIDSSLNLGELIQPGTDALTKEEAIPVAGQTAAEESSVLRSVGGITAQPQVALFDGENSVKDSTEVQRATFFFETLEEFHASYSRFVTDRVKDDSGGEPPRRIRIAVLDTGIDFRHSGLIEAKKKGRVKREWCHSWVGAGTDVEDEDDELHGTNCVYVLHKAAPEANIYVEKVFRSNSFRIYQAENIARAIKHAVETWDVDIISMSFGLRPPVPRKDGNHAEENLALQDYQDLVDGIQTAIRNASVQSPRIMFAAASNNGKNEKRAFPAKYEPWVICVHASDGKGSDGGINPPTERGANFMTLGMGLNLMERQWTHEQKGRTPIYKEVYKSGTSFATPIAAGIAATVLDVASRVSAIKDRAKEKLRRPEEMQKMLWLMSSPKHDLGNQYCFLAPWNHWEKHWQANETKSRIAWDLINDLFEA
ncbi:uncharacterized protein BDZ99DRAFT_527942 [Mytilinidion resinicola]|uniref:Subtilisin-like protein n=1 Tax=Mytilinidion resinicola TaxID=574789 RepID=A0A6A6XZJ8_9PEZI|nr:uncharacterized protein BDZ99DRAFT_527942 [Mytilinidion resinicola]KAF2801991.1 hypothetical protein BDZ99DRAFT_527942 [Mytilinidion resinicola]